MREIGGPIRELAPAKVNLLLHVGPRRHDGLHELCSLFASIDLADEVVVSEADGGSDTVVCPAVEGPNICLAALEAFRAAAAAVGGADRLELPPLEVRILKRIPVAAGLGGGSADAAAALRAANRMARGPLGLDALRRVAAGVGADVPSQIEPRHALVGGAGEVVEPVVLPRMFLVLASQHTGLATADVYAEADRIGATRERLRPADVRAVADGSLDALTGALENDLQAAALSLRPELSEVIGALERSGALVALVTGSGPTVFGVFDGEQAARRAAASLPGAVVATIA